MLVTCHAACRAGVAVTRISKRPGCEPHLRTALRGGFFVSNQCYAVVSSETFRILFAVVDPSPRVRDDIGKLEYTRCC